MSTCITEALQEALKLCSLAETMTACRGDDDFIAGVRAKIEAVLSIEPGEAEGWRDIPVTDETLDYVSKYGGRCRDCADYFGVCPCGLPCNSEARRAAIRHVLCAINYGMTHGYLSATRQALESDNG